MARHKNANWNLPDGQMENWHQVHVAVLMDIRDELQGLRNIMDSMNNLLHCRNFTQIPRKLDAIRLNTTRKHRNGK